MVRVLAARGAGAALKSKRRRGAARFDLLFPIVARRAGIPIRRRYWPRTDRVTRISTRNGSGCHYAVEQKLSGSDWLGIVLCGLGMGGGALITAFGRSAARWGGGTLFTISAIGLFIWLGHYWPVDAQTSTNVAGNCSDNSIHGDNNTQTNDCSTTIITGPPHNPYKLYLLNGAETGDVVGIHPSTDQTSVTFDRIMVPDDFPWGNPVQIQHAKITCEKPQGGNYGRIEGMGAPINKYWSVTCKVIGPA